jgi:hypothetical protein
MPGTQTSAPNVHQLNYTFIQMRFPTSSIKAKQVL